MNSLLYSSLILLLFFILIIWGCKLKTSANLLRESCLQNLNDLRGLFALEIVIGHVVRYEKTLLFPLGKFMICSVAFFFFVSAFGMVVSFEKKANYLNFHFILSKPVFLFIFSIISFTFNIAVDAFCPLDLHYLASPLFETYLLRTNWYIWELIVFYFIFFFVYFILKYIHKFRIPLICVITISLSIIMYLSGFAECYFASSFAFPAGLLCGEYFLNIKNFLFSRKGIILTIILSIFGLMSLFLKTENLLSMVFMRNSICLSVLIITIFICSCFSVGNNPIARILCKYSAEIYLSQFIWLDFSAAYSWNYMIRIPFVITATLITAIFLHPLILLLKRLLCTLANNIYMSRHTL